MEKKYYKIKYKSQSNPKDKSEYGTYYFYYLEGILEIDAYAYDEAKTIAIAEALKKGWDYLNFTWSKKSFYTFTDEEYNLFKKMQNEEDKDYDALYNEVKILCKQS